PSLAQPLARLLFSVYCLHLQEFSSDMVAPVPLHRSRERERGFNQSLLLARYFSRLVDIPFHPRLLTRIRATQMQAGLSRRARRLNLAGAFLLPDKTEVAEKAVLLVDDVFTTGATVNECARLLRVSGARRVNVLTLARVIQG
ncbi:MAG TPA: ComF family protein, partial [Terriglobia bacterium]|nr:ComF family protein [Terriglobia bacterium]